MPKHATPADALNATTKNPTVGKVGAKGQRKPSRNGADAVTNIARVKQ
jgi:hypothetical protein